MGADIVVHSATKYLDGQGRCLGGAVVGSRELIDKVLGFLRAAGPTMSPFNAWVFLKGLETLQIRMEAISPMLQSWPHAGAPESIQGFLCRSGGSPRSPAGSNK